MGFPDGSDSKESAHKAGDMSSIPGSGRSSGGGHGNPLQYSCLENPHGQRSLVGYSPWGHKESDMTEPLSLHSSSMSRVVFFPFSEHPDRIYWVPTMCRAGGRPSSCTVRCTDKWYSECTGMPSASHQKHPQMSLYLYLWFPPSILLYKRRGPSSKGQALPKCSRSQHPHLINELSSGISCLSCLISFIFSTSLLEVKVDMLCISSLNKQKQTFSWVHVPPLNWKRVIPMSSCLL